MSSEVSPVEGLVPPVPTVLGPVVPVRDVPGLVGVVRGVVSRIDALGRLLREGLL